MSAQKPRSGSVLAALLGTLGFSVLAGLLVAVMVTPAIAITGATVNSSIGIFDSLPSFIEIDQQPEQNRIFATKDGKPYQIATIFDQNREEVTWDNVSDAAKDAAVSGEDKRFYEHGGVDIQGIIRAGVGNLSGKELQGASTITQQVVKNIYVQQALEKDTAEERTKAYNEAVSPSIERKLKEMKLAISLEKQYSKQQILLAYLNIAFFGDNAYGIQAAAEHYFSVSAKDLTVTQAASLIAIVQEPSTRSLQDPANYPANLVRRDFIINSMYTDGKITAAERDTALAAKLDKTTIKISDPRNGCISANKYSKFFCDYVRQLVKDLPAFGANATERAANFKRGGYDIYTTLDVNLQTVATKANQKYAPNDYAQLKLGSSTVSVEVGTGRILVMTENKVFNDTEKGGGKTATAVNFSTDKAYGGSSGFQPGSTYKPFTLLTWLKAGHGLNESVNGSGRTEAASSFTDSCTPGGWGGPFTFKNDDSRGGQMTVATGTQYSVNGVFVSMALKLDLCDIRNTAQAFGVHRADGTPLQTNPSSVLGTNEVAPLTMAAAYAGIANSGMYCAPIAVDKIIGPDGKELAGQAQTCKQAIDADVANTAAFAMQKVMTAGTGTASNPYDGVEYIGKTGTTDDSVHTWMVGASRKVATAVWVGNISGKVPLRSVYTAYGQTAVMRHQIFKTVATAIDKVSKYRGGDFPSATASMLVGSGVKVPSLSGKSYDYAKSVLEASGFKVKNGGTVTSSVSEGDIAKSSPSSGTLVSRGDEVTIYTSNGQLTSMPNIVGDGQQSVDSAQATLSGAGFTSIKTQCQTLAAGDAGRDGKVVGSNPTAGKSLRYDNNVTIFYGSLDCSKP
ncbi:transglycosylase domain-containing protein [Glaciihabitans sp. dw_435]|uniref:transglycosylase domain-containing protein n=1 Tax=Glaciihabitans sp. dw_435 TaxID=2720081 RepID=UPI001BD5A937|nr:transglycosylase domain-containing protein [Glaciihabitans sp. dw_435]